MLRQFGDKTKIIAHRGLCNVFPQCTLESLQTALYKADLAQLDILLTKDNQLIAFHDRGLNRLTNVSQFQEFKQRKCSENLDDKQKFQEDWWVKDFTLEELKKLSVSQPHKNRPALKSITFKISTLEQVLNMALDVKSNQKHPKKNAGLLIQLKDERYQRDSPRDKILVQKLIQYLLTKGLGSINDCKQKNLPIILQSFCNKILIELNNLISLPIIHLFDSTTIVSSQLLRSIKLENTIGIGITQKHLENIQMFQSCKIMNLQIFYWTLVEDQKQRIPLKLENYEKAYIQLKNMGITGLICQFPEKCSTTILEF